jgi:Gas vesicle protein G
MDLVSLTLGLPFAPLRGVIAIARLLEEEAEQELYSPAQVHQELEEIDRARTEEQLSGEMAEEQEQQVVNRLLGR